MKDNFSRSDPIISIIYSDCTSHLLLLGICFLKNKEQIQSPNKPRRLWGEGYSQQRFQQISQTKESMLMLMHSYRMPTAWEHRLSSLDTRVFPGPQHRALHTKELEYTLIPKQDRKNWTNCRLPGRGADQQGVRPLRANTQRADSGRWPRRFLLVHLHNAPDPEAQSLQGLPSTSRKLHTYIYIYGLNKKE